MDEHAVRVTQPLMDAWRDFQQGHATLLDLSRTAQQASGALDHSDAQLLALLERAWGDLEFAYYATDMEQHAAEASRILQPVLNILTTS